MLKHALIAEKGALATLLAFDTDTFDLRQLAEMLKESVEIKKDSGTDPHEKHIRKA